MIGATLFSGIGAPETAMPSWRWPWHAEIEKFPRAVLAQRHPDSKNLGDVTADDFTQRALKTGGGRPDVLVFGSPCQSFSIAGKRLGMDDPRGNLALVALGIVARLEPRWFILENVPGLFSSFSGSEYAESEVRKGPVGGTGSGEEDRDFATLLSRVQELGYSLAWTVLDAQHFGVAQRRERVFAVGHLGDWRGPAAVLFEPEGLCGNHPPRREAGQRIADSLTVGANQCSGRPGDFVAHSLRAQAQLSHREDADNIVISHALNAHGGTGRIDYESETFITHALRADGFDASEDGTGRGTPIIAFAHQQGGNIDLRIAADGSALTLQRSQGQAIAFSSKDHGADAMCDLSPTLRAGTHDKSHANAGVPPAIAFAQNQLGEVRTSECVGTINTNSNASGRATPMASVGSAVRRLTPRECERLQGYPDDYTAITFRGKPAADGPRYKALGNSMAVPVMRWILSRIDVLQEIPAGTLTEQVSQQSPLSHESNLKP